MTKTIISITNLYIKKSKDPNFFHTFCAYKRENVDQWHIIDSNRNSFFKLEVICEEISFYIR